MIYPKAILNYQALLFQDSDGNKVLNFVYEVKENYDDDSLAFDNYNQYSYYILVSQISLTLVLDYLLGSPYFEMTWGKNQLAFPLGEYYDLDNNALLNPSIIYSVISSTIYAQ